MCIAKRGWNRRKARPRAFPKKPSCSLCLCGEFPLRRLKRKMPRPSKSVRRGRGGRRFHHRGTESTKICRAEEDLLEGFPRLIAFGNSVSVRGSCLRMDVQREEPLEPPKSACSGIPKKTFVLSVPLW